MKLLSESRDWMSAAPAIEDDSGHRRLLSLLRRMLGTEHLVVLSGLGTSMDIKPLSDDAARPPSMDALWAAAREAVGDGWEAAQKAAHWTAEDGENIERFLSRLQMARALTGDAPLATAIRRSEEAIVAACSFVAPDTPVPTHENFLRKVARRPPRLPRTAIFTTNYDLAFEVAASNAGFAVIDGFSHVAPQRFNGGYFDVDFAQRDSDRSASAVDWMPNVVQLLKLHGSVDWRLDGDGVLRDPYTTRPLIIYPESSKFEASYQPPFLELMGRFQTALRRPDTALLIVGSGLGDKHILAPVMAAVRSNVRLSVLVVAPGLSNPFLAPAHAATLRDLIGDGDQRLALLDGTFADLVTALPDLMADTEQERHDQRVQRLP